MWHLWSQFVYIEWTFFPYLQVYLWTHIFQIFLSALLHFWHTHKLIPSLLIGYINIHFQYYWNKLIIIISVLDLPVEVPGYGKITIDIGYGGGFYAVAPASSVNLDVTQSKIKDLIDAAEGIKSEFLNLKCVKGTLFYLCGFHVPTDPF